MVESSCCEFLRLLSLLALAAVFVRVLFRRIVSFLLAVSVAMEVADADDAVAVEGFSALSNN